MTIDVLHLILLVAVPLGLAVVANYWTQSILISRMDERLTHVGARVERVENNQRDAERRLGALEGVFSGANADNRRR